MNRPKNGFVTIMSRITLTILCSTSLLSLPCLAQRPTTNSTSAPLLLNRRATLQATPSPNTGRQPQGTSVPPSRKPSRPLSIRPDFKLPQSTPPRPTKPTWPQWNPPQIPSVTVTPRPTAPPRQPQPRPQVNPRPRPVQPQPSPQPRPTVIVNRLPSTTPKPASNALPQNALPVPVPQAPTNTPVAKRVGKASRELTQAVHGDVRGLLKKQLRDLNQKSLTGPLGKDQLEDSSLASQLGELQKLIEDGAGFDQLAGAGKEIGKTLNDLNAGGAPAGFGDWAQGFANDVKETILLAGVQDAINDALTGGAGPAGGPGAGGPGGFAPGGGGPGPGPGAGGPGGFAPGGGGPGPGPGAGGPGGLAPGGGGGPGPGPGGGGPGGIAPPGGGGGGGGGGAGGGGGIDIDINLGFWFGHGCCPIVCCPYYPPGMCCWIGNHVLVCGIGYGPTYVMYGPPAYCGLPYPTVEPLPNFLPETDYFGRIVIMNPEETGGTVNYLLDDRPFTMESGMMQDISSQLTEIRFGRGPGFGTARYSLRPGTYKFVITELGWELVKTRFRAILDNTANAADFHMLLDGEPVAIVARSQQGLVSEYPLIVEFDDGDGGSPARKALGNGNVFTIGVNGSTGLWDLFPGDAASSGAGVPAEAELLASTGPMTPPEMIDLPLE